MSDFRWFQSISTGKTGRYPAHYASRPSFVEIDGDEATCEDCFIDQDIIEDVNEDVLVPEEVEDEPYEIEDDE